MSRLILSWETTVFSTWVLTLSLGSSLSTKLKTVLAMRHSTPGCLLLARDSRPSLLLHKSAYSKYLRAQPYLRDIMVCTSIRSLSGKEKSWVGLSIIKVVALATKEWFNASSSAVRLLGQRMCVLKGKYSLNGFIHLDMCGRRGKIWII